MRVSAAKWMQQSYLLPIKNVLEGPKRSIVPKSGESVLGSGCAERCGNLSAVFLENTEPDQSRTRLGPAGRGDRVANYPGCRGLSRRYELTRLFRIERDWPLKLWHHGLGGPRRADFKRNGAGFLHPLFFGPIGFHTLGYRFSLSCGHGTPALLFARDFLLRIALVGASLRLVSVKNSLQCFF